jgi:hypothetical protein
LFDAANRIVLAIRELTELEIVAQIDQAFFEFGERRNTRGDRRLQL